MLIAIIVGLVLLACVIGVMADAYDFIEAAFIGFLTLVAGGLLAGVILAGLEFVASRPFDRHFITEQKSLVALQDGTQTTGVFFLGSGFINGESTYTYYLRDGAGYKLENAPANTVTVYQDSSKPYLIQQTDCKTSAEWLAFCVSDGRVTEIHVPKGTIKSGFALDAK